MATTISRTYYDSVLDDSGTGTDGTEWDKAGLDALLDAIDAIFTGAVTIDGTFTAGGNLGVSGVGPHAIGGATAADVQLFLRGSFAPSTSALGADIGLFVGQTVTAQANRDSASVWIEGTLAEAGSGTHPIFASLRVKQPTITGGAAALTNAATVYIVGGPIGGTNNYALWVDDGVVRLDTAVALGGGSAPTLGTIGGSGPATAGQNEWIRINTQNGIRFVPAWA